MDDDKLYSRNILKDGDFEGPLVDWKQGWIEQVKGGATENGSKCVRVGLLTDIVGESGRGYMYQELNTLPQPPAFKYGAMILPEHDITTRNAVEDNLNIKAEIKLTLKYADGTRDEFKAPCRFDSVDKTFIGNVAFIG